MTCSNPIGFEALVAYWLGEAPPHDEAALEEHLFACAYCSRRLEELAALAGGVRTAVEGGRVNMVVSGRFIEAMKRSGLRLREYALDPGGSVHCTIRPDDDVVISRLRAPLAGVQRLDVVYSGRGKPDQRLADVPFDASAGEVFVVPSAAWLRTLPEYTTLTRLVSVSDQGESLLGEYTFMHSPS